MNGYDAQDMASQGADGFRNGYQAGYADAVKAIEAAQPAAAPEAVAWFTDDPLAERLRDELKAAQPAAPVAAAPAEMSPEFTAAPVTVTRDADGEIVLVKQDDTIIASTCHAGGKDHSVPGIDLVSDILTDLSNVAASWVVEAAGTAANAQNECAMQMHEAIERWSNKLQLGDASPKGATLNEQFGIAEGLDSPKASSEARDAALNTLAQMFHNSEEMEGPDGMVVSIDLSLWHEALEAYEVLIDGYDEVTLATSAQAQASDAEGRP